MRNLVLFFCLYSLVVGQLAVGQIDAPRLGFWRDPQNRVRPLYGIAGSFVPGAPVRTGVLAFAWYGDGGWLRTEAGIERLDAAGDTIARLPAGPARFSATTAWLTEQNVAFQWDGASLRNVAIDETEFTLPEPESEALAPDWYHVRLRGRSYAVRTTPGREARFVLPEADDAENQ